MRTQFLTLLAAFCASVMIASASSLNLAGQWRLQLDPKDEGIAAQQWEKTFPDSIRLPGTTALAGKGNALDITINLERPAMQSLHQRFRYIGAAWYQRTVKLPADWSGNDIELTLERVIWESRVWVNGVEAGAPQLSLTTPHRYDLTKLLKPGAENTITLRIDNREKVSIGILGHAYTDETQSIWNGVVGRISLDAKPKLRVNNLKLRPELARNGVNVSVSFVNNTGGEKASSLKLTSSAGGAGLTQDVKISAGESVQEFFLPLPADTGKWSEFTPALHHVTAALAESKITSAFGLREFKADGRALKINGQPTFLRGTVQCAEFPKTGHPDMTGAQWEKIFTTARAHGLNHLRFHSWCPPEIAFATADRLGFYLQVELPNWTFKMGQIPSVDAWLEDEGHRIFREYGNHPSFVMFSLGNELAGDLDKMDAFVARLRKLEPQLLFTSTTFAFSPRGKSPGPEDDFFVSQETKSGWVRGQGFLNNTKPNTTSDYAEGLSSVKMPLVTHEVGQYVVYPNLAELPKYKSTPMRATAWEAIKADLEKKGRLDEAADYTRASGQLAALLYKEDVERALRTKDLSGIQLLQLQDFPGQSTATVGLLDAFWDSKGLITPAAFRKFCQPTVPLVRMAKMVFQNDETFTADVEIAHFGAAPLTNATVTWTLRDGTRIVGEGKFNPALIALGNGQVLGRITQPLAAIATAANLTLTVAIPGTDIGNEWSVWVYPVASAILADVEPGILPGGKNVGGKGDAGNSNGSGATSAGPGGKMPPSTAGKDARRHNDGVNIFQIADEKMFSALRAGKTVLLLPARASVKSPLDGRFIPVFWSPLHFPNQPGTLGAMIDAAHPVWRDFPTGSSTDWQWWELLATSFAVNLDGVNAKLAMPFRFVDRYNRNSVAAGIFEAKVGAGKLLVCTLDIERDLAARLAARQLRRSVLAYLASEKFSPKGTLAEADLKAMFQSARYTVSVDSWHPEYPTILAVDGDAKTFWHTDWSTGDKLPATFALDFHEEKLLRGFDYTPRQNQNRGRIAHYTVEVSRDGKTWLPWQKEATFPDTKEKQSVRFEKPVQARHLRLTALSEHGGANHAAIAEFDPVADAITPDVRDLGIVPGFNDGK